MWCVLMFVTYTRVVKIDFWGKLNDILGKYCLKPAFMLKYNMNAIFGNLHQPLYCSGTVY